jgi:superfamily II DNA or RNA helicase
VVQFWIQTDLHYGHLDVKNVDQRVLNTLTEELRFRPDGYRFSPAFKKHRWDGYKYLFNRANGEFRIGLLQRVKRTLERIGPVGIVNMMNTPWQMPDCDLRVQSDVIKPFDFQQKIREVVENNSRGIISSPTSTGKTVMMGIAAAHLKRRTLVILNDLTLLGQTKRSLERTLGVEVGMIGDGEFELCDVTCATVQSLSTILGVVKFKRKPGRKPRAPSPKRPDLEEWLKGAGLVMHDEVHQADGAMCSELYLQIPNATSIYGFSATPYDWADKQQGVANIELEQVFGTMIYDTSKADFIALGLKVPIVIRDVQVPAHFTYKGMETDEERSAAYKTCLKQEIVESDIWLGTIIREAQIYIRDGMSVFIYAAPNHGLAFAEKIANSIEKAHLVNGSTDRREREKIFDALHRKEILCVVSDIGGIGLDVPSLDVILLASDVVDVRQIRGRVERACPEAGKEYGILVDFWKDCQFLKKHRQKRINQYTAGQNIKL